MADQLMGDDVYQPDNEEQADAAPPDLDDALWMSRQVVSGGGYV